MQLHLLPVGQLDVQACLTKGTKGNLFEQELHFLYYGPQYVSGSYPANTPGFSRPPATVCLRPPEKYVPFLDFRPSVPTLHNTKPVLWFFAAIMASGGLATILLCETKGKTLEELSGDDRE
ncbi:hypothetical protein BC830DRAFT_1217748 [Chytriomyces sp. MP71]|nr:hypothetical protein BC830DRAFT_1217748 [Chytriomyces sp. MP71]